MLLIVREFLILLDNAFSPIPLKPFGSKIFRKKKVKVSSFYLSMFRVVQKLCRYRDVVKRKHLPGRINNLSQPSRPLSIINRKLRVRFFTTEHIQETNKDEVDEEGWSKEDAGDPSDENSKAYYCNKAMYAENHVHAFAKTIKIFEMMETENIEVIRDHYAVSIISKDLNIVLEKCFVLQVLY